MLSLIEVTCPHCAARGQIMVPPPGAIIIGPCPECSGMVAVFCGQVLPLDNEIMGCPSNLHKREHVGEVLANFVRERVERLYAGESDPEVGFDDDDSGEMAHGAPYQQPGTDVPTLEPISVEELDSFVNVDLRLLDNPNYFKAIFQQD